MEHISFQPQILNLLQRIYDGRCLLTVTLPDSPHLFSSALLEINADQSYLILDELKPDQGHSLLLQQQRCRVQTGLKGISVSFVTTLMGSGYQNGIAYYRVSLPKNLSYGQRRAHFRPRVSSAHRTEVQIKDAQGGTIIGNLQDISLGGLRLRSDNRQVVQPPPDAPLTCCFTLPDGTVIDCPIAMRFFSSNSDSCQMAGHFLELTPTQRRALQKFVTDLEREALRKTPREA